jgi:hypothetical protein
MTVPARGPLPPLRKSITVGWSPEAAFRRFTAEIASWWPLRSHSVGEETRHCVTPPRRSIFEARNPERASANA